MTRSRTRKQADAARRIALPVPYAVIPPATQVPPPSSLVEERLRDLEAQVGTLRKDLATSKAAWAAVLHVLEHAVRQNSQHPPPPSTQSSLPPCERNAHGGVRYHKEATAAPRVLSAVSPGDTIRPHNTVSFLTSAECEEYIRTHGLREQALAGQITLYLSDRAPYSESDFPGPFPRVPTVPAPWAPGPPRERA